MNQNYYDDDLHQTLPLQTPTNILTQQPAQMTKNTKQFIKFNPDSIHSPNTPKPKPFSFLIDPFLTVFNSIFDGTFTTLQFDKQTLLYSLSILSIFLFSIAPLF